jgi:hypothetical protein
MIYDLRFTIERSYFRALGKFPLNPQLAIGNPQSK